MDWFTYSPVCLTCLFGIGSLNLTVLDGFTKSLIGLTCLFGIGLLVFARSFWKLFSYFK